VVCQALTAKRCIKTDGSEEGTDININGTTTTRKSATDYSCAAFTKEKSCIEVDGDGKKYYAYTEAEYTKG